MPQSLITGHPLKYLWEVLNSTWYLNPPLLIHTSEYGCISSSTGHCPASKCSVQAYKEAFKPQALGHYTNSLQPPWKLFCQVFSPKMHNAVILIMCILNSSKDHISLSPLPIFLHQGLIQGPCMGKGPTGKARPPGKDGRRKGKKALSS